ncbi:MAG: xanthine dehydrogenase family protein molybdopterin-binding subunit [Halobacteriota archaeon]
MKIDTISPDDARPSELVGSSIQRREDPHLLTGDTEYTDDIQYPREAHLALLGSQYGHATVESIDTSGAEALDGVLGIYTQDDVDASGVPGTLRVDSPADGVAPEHPLLSSGKVTYQGQPVAAVVATDRYTAHEALGHIDVSYDRLDAVVDPVGALDDDAATIHDEAPDNRAFTLDVGDAEATAEVFDGADRVVSMDLDIARVIPTAMEPRAALARYRPSTGNLSVEMSTQNPHTVRDDIASSLNVPEHKIRVRPPDVGGGFGAKLQPYTGHVLAAWCAMQLERPVKWVATRSEDFLSMVHSRQQVVSAEAAVDEDGTLRAIRAESVVPIGGFLGPGGSGVPGNLASMVNGQYAVEAGHINITGVFTNMAPYGAYRGAGRPEATYFIERLVDTVARELDIDPAKVRRKSFIQPHEFPYETGFGRTYDSGDYELTLDTALDAVDYDAFRAEQAAAREEGRYLGIGLSCYVEACGAAPGWHESGVVQVLPSGKVVVKSGTTEIGTGHRTSFAQIVSNVLGVAYDDVEVIEGDTDHVIDGGGTAGSRGLAVGGSAVRQSAETVREKATTIAGHLLEAAASDVVVDDGSFHVRGAPDRSVTFDEVAAAAYGGDLPQGTEAGLEATSYFDPPNYTFPFGTHVAVVEVDPDSGEVDLVRYYAVDDVGEQVNPKLVEGQIHGGVVQGIGQALYEGAIYDENGTLMTGSLQDYAIPKSMQLPEIETESTVTPCPHNPLGVKGVGEAGAIAAPPAIVNAVLDALAPLGVEAIDMPMSAATVWDALQDAESSPGK